MEIRGPIVPPKLTDITSDQNQTKQSPPASEPTTASNDVVEVAKKNTFADHLDAAQQNDGSTGEEQLTADQQNFASSFHPETEHFENVSDFLKGTQSSSQDPENSGLQLPFQINQDATNPES